MGSKRPHSPRTDRREFDHGLAPRRRGATARQCTSCCWYVHAAEHECAHCRTSPCAVSRGLFALASQWDQLQHPHPPHAAGRSEDGASRDTARGAAPARQTLLKAMCALVRASHAACRQVAAESAVRLNPAVTCRIPGGDDTTQTNGRRVDTRDHAFPSPGKWHIAALDSCSDMSASVPRTTTMRATYGSAGMQRANASSKRARPADQAALRRGGTGSTRLCRLSGLGCRLEPPRANKAGTGWVRRP